MSLGTDQLKTPRPPQEYSESFKRQGVAEYESGFYTKAMLRRKYGVSGVIPVYLGG